MKRTGNRQFKKPAGQEALLSPTADDGGQANAVNGIERLLEFLRHHGWVFGLFLVTAIMIAYLPVWHAGFIWDDDAYVTQNKMLTAPDGLSRIWLSAHRQSQYFPLVYTSLRFECALWGLNPLGYHLFNVLLHAVNAILLWQLLRRLAVPGAWLAAAIFALHPVQVESVAWITELKNVQSTLFYLLALLAWVKFIEKPGLSSWRFYWLALLFHALALFSKTTACTLPMALLLVLGWRRETIGWRRILQVLPFLLMGMVMGIVSVWWENHLGNYTDPDAGVSFGFVEKTLVATHAVWFYAAKVFWPFNLTFIYPRWAINPRDPLQYAGLAGCIVFAALLWWRRRIFGRSVTAGVIFFVAALSPLLGFIPLYTFRYSFVADHYQYLACAGLLIPFAALMSNRMVSECFGRITYGCLLGGLLLLLGFLTWKQAHIYADSETLWRDTLAKDPSSWMAHNNLANALLKKGEANEAILHCRRALAIQPDDIEANYNLGIALLVEKHPDEAIVQFQKTLAIQPDNADARDNLGAALFQKGQTDDAIVQFQKALAIEPDNADAHYHFGNALLKKAQANEAIIEFQKALAIQPDNADARDNLGIALLQTGQLADAITQFQKALGIKPGNAEVHNNLGTALVQSGQLNEAIIQFQQTLAIQPDNSEVHNNLGNVLLQMGKLDEATIQFQKALAINPGLSKAQYSLAKLAWLLATSPDAFVRNGTKAVDLAGQADRLSGGNNPQMAATLAAAYAEEGHFPEAINNAQRALQLATSRNNAALVIALEQQLKLYQAGSPFHQTGASR